MTDAKTTNEAARRRGHGKAAAAQKRRRSATSNRLLEPQPAPNPRSPLAMAVLGQFRLIFRSAKIHFQWVQERSGISGSQLWVLAEIQRRPGIRVTELARAMAVHQSTASNLIEGLHRRGLLQRERSTKDQRVVNLSLTASGRQTVARAPKPLEGVLPDALYTLDPNDLAALRKYLDKLASAMKVHDRAGKRIPLSEI